MTTNRFFVHPRQIKRTFIYLDGNEHHHLSRVARIKTSELIQLFDDSGREFIGKVEKIEKNKTIIRVLKETEVMDDKVKISLAQALLKSKSMELVIQKAAELGAHSFFPLLSERCVVRPKEKQALKLIRWRKISLEASKQSGRGIVCRIDPPGSQEEILENSQAELKLLLSESTEGEKLLKDILLTPLLSRDKKTGFPSSVLLIVGPEGGWTEMEQNYMINSGCTAVSLGKFVLRSETAAVASLAMISHFWNV
ncbi:MAG: RsmE family RNA methyltransferase [Acidobacteriota bacterium]